MRVLLAIDNSQCSDAAIDSVLERPWPEATRFHLLSVVEPFHPEYAGWVSPYVPAALEAQRERLIAVHQMLKHDADRLIAKFGQDGVTCAVAEGFIRDKILEAAELWSADLIIMGTHGRKGFEKLIMGSISESVLSNAPCSVEIVKSKHA